MIRISNLSKVSDERRERFAMGFQPRGDAPYSVLRTLGHGAEVFSLAPLGERAGVRGQRDPKPRPIHGALVTPSP